MKNLSRRKGFTLVELMMAMVIVALGLFAVAQMGLVSIRGNAYAREWMEAYDIAQAAMEELKLRATQWVRYAGGNGPAYNTTVLQPMVPDTSIQNMPAAGNDLLYANLRSLLMFHGKTIAAGQNITDSNTLNLFGDVAGSRTVYRLHYVAHWMPPAPGDPTNQNANLIRITLFVSWDNKDHGDQNTPWNNVTQEQYFWKRHMITMTRFVSPDFHWSEGI